MNISQVRKLVPFACAGDVSIAVTVFGHYTDPTMQVVGIVGVAVFVIGAMVVWFRTI